MNKIDFPIGVELPLRGGGVAVLSEFFEGHWHGRYMEKHDRRWRWHHWMPNGQYMPDPPCVAAPRLMTKCDILPPKRRAWLVWGHRAHGFVQPCTFSSLSDAEEWRGIYGGALQEIVEP